jgi:hypothetical protein
MEFNTCSPDLEPCTLLIPPPVRPPLPDIIASGLPATGGDWLLILLIAVTLVLAGTLCVHIARRWL